MPPLLPIVNEINMQEPEGLRRQQPLRKPFGSFQGFNAAILQNCSAAVRFSDGSPLPALLKWNHHARRPEEALRIQEVL